MLASKSTIGKEPYGAGAGGCVTQSRSTRSRLELGVEECVTVRRDFARGDEHEERVVRRRHDVAVALEAQAEEMPVLSEATGGTTIGSSPPSMPQNTPVGPCEATFCFFVQIQCH